MREIYKNPMLYYLIAPIAVCVWPLLVATIYLPAARQQMKDELAQCVEGQAYIGDILKYDPERTNGVVNKDETGTNSFPKVIDQVANTCQIPSSGCDYTAGIADKKTQNAKVTLKGVGIVQAAKFLSQIQSRWVGLKCDQVILTKKQGVPDQWDVEMKFWYAS